MEFWTVEDLGFDFDADPPIAATEIGEEAEYVVSVNGYKQNGGEDEDDD